MSEVVVRTQYFSSGKSVSEKFTNYIAKREGVDKTINTKRSEVFAQYAAERLGYDTPEAWRNLVRSKQFEIAYYHKIPADNLKW